MHIRSNSRSRFGTVCLDLRGLPAAVLLSVGVALLPISASAQTPPKGQPGGPPQVMEPPSENPVPPSNPADADSNQPLSERLKQGEGVLEPPRSVDPGIKKPVPEDFESKTPVIKPPQDGKDADEPLPPPPAKQE